MLSEQAKKEIQKIRDEVPDPQSALLPALYLAQREYGGWLPEQALDEVAAVMELPAAQVAGMASFYTMLNKQPVANLSICKEGVRETNSMSPTRLRHTSEIRLYLFI